MYSNVESQKRFTSGTKGYAQRWITSEFTFPNALRRRPALAVSRTPAPARPGAGRAKQHTGAAFGVQGAGCTGRDLMEVRRPE